MPVHDWSRVVAGIFRKFHHAWIEEIKRELNNGLLPPEYYALAEQVAGNLGPNVPTLHELTDAEGPIAVGDVPPDIPPSLRPNANVSVPLERTYQAAWRSIPRRWQRILEPASS